MGAPLECRTPKQIHSMITVTVSLLIRKRDTEYYSRGECLVFKNLDVIFHKTVFRLKIHSYCQDLSTNVELTNPLQRNSEMYAEQISNIKFGYPRDYARDLYLDENFSKEI